MLSPGERERERERESNNSMQKGEKKIWEGLKAFRRHAMAFSAAISRDLKWRVDDGGNKNKKDTPAWSLHGPTCVLTHVC